MSLCCTCVLWQEMYDPKFGSQWDAIEQTDTSAACYKLLSESVPTVKTPNRAVTSHQGLGVIVERPIARTIYTFQCLPDTLDPNELKTTR
jgi:hypothetical protein